MLYIDQISLKHTRPCQNDAADVLVDDLHRSDASTLGIAIAEVVEPLTCTPVPDADTHTK